MITDERLKEIAGYWKGPGLTAAIKGSEIGAMAKELLLLREILLQNADALRDLKGRIEHAIARIDKFCPER